MLHAVRRIASCLPVTLLCLLLARPAFADAGPLAGLRLQDQHRRPVTSATIADRPTLLHFVFTTCSTSCPLQVRELAAVHDRLPEAVRQRVRFVSVSVDPLQDTPQTLAAFARRLDAQRPGWHFATGDPAQVWALVERLQAMDRNAARPAPQDHRTSLYLYDARGRLVQRYGGTPVDRERLVAELSQVVRMAP